MADASVIQTATVRELLTKGSPIPEALIHRIDSDLCQVQAIAVTLRRLCSNFSTIDEELDIYEVGTIVDAMAYRIGRLLNPWTDAGSFADDLETEILLPEAQEAGDAS